MNNLTPLEINKLIAEAKGYESSTTINGILFQKVYYENNIKYYGDHYYNWAENISEAFELFEEMPNAILQKNKIDNKDDYWLAYQASYDGVRGIECNPINAPTATLAICKAWLKWKGII